MLKYKRPSKSSTANAQRRHSKVCRTIHSGHLVTATKLANPRVKQITQLAEHPRFQQALTFFAEEQCDDELNPLSESTNGMGEWWQTYQTLNHKEQQRAIDEFAKQARRGGRDDRNRRKRSQQTDEPKTDVKPNDKSSTTKDSEIPKHTGQTKSAKEHDTHRQQTSQGGT